VLDKYFVPFRFADSQFGGYMFVALVFEGQVACYCIM